MEARVLSPDFPFVHIPGHLSDRIGNPNEGTRLYRRYGKESEIEDWFDAVYEICQGNGSVSPGGVAMYVRVSRPAVHKRLKEGRLTGFLFHQIEEGRFFKGRKRLKDGGMPYCCIPVSECKAWAEEMKKRRGELPKDEPKDRT